MNNLLELLKIWTFNDSNEYIAECDRGVLKDNLKMSFFYRTHLFPLPFIGNVQEPDVLILALNPSYDPIHDEEDISGKEVYKYLNQLYEVNFFVDQEKSISILGNFTFNWWKKNVFNDLSLRSNSTKIGLFNLCGYHSRGYEEVPKRCLNNGKYLTSQEKTRKIVFDLINCETTRLVIIVWGSKYWNTYLGEECFIRNKNKIIVLNEENSRNKSIAKCYKNESKNAILKEIFNLCK